MSRVDKDELMDRWIGLCLNAGLKMKRLEREAEGLLLWLLFCCLLCWMMRIEFEGDLKVLLYQKLYSPKHSRAEARGEERSGQGTGSKPWD